MKIGVAQIRSIQGDIQANIDKHIKCIELAVSLNAEALFFPELSLTSYEPEKAEADAITVEDSRLEVFQGISNNYKITIGVGAPLKSEKGIHISMIIFQPFKPGKSYSKQKLHPDEFPYFVHGDQQMIVAVGGHKIAPAICFESLQPDHAGHAKNIGADIYLASVAKSSNGVAKAMLYFPTLAKKLQMPVLMSNCIGFCDHFESAGYSSIWNKKGHLMAQLNDSNEGILIFDTEEEETTTKSIH